ncbi:hypothetical protein QAD02_006593, partial [Eretmocerus hayati]
MTRRTILQEKMSVMRTTMNATSTSTKTITMIKMMTITTATMIESISNKDVKIDMNDKDDSNKDDRDIEVNDYSDKNDNVHDDDDVQDLNYENNSVDVTITGRGVW